MYCQNIKGFLLAKNTPHILVVDDEKDTLSILKKKKINLVITDL